MTTATDEPASSPFIWPPVIFGLAALLAAILSWVWPWTFLPGTFLGFLLRLAGALVVAGSIWLALSATRRFRAAGTPVPPTKPTTAIVTEGVYRRTRNPMYLAMTLAMLGLGFLFASFWFVLLVPLAIIAVTKLAIEREERYLEARFGDDYRRYRSEVRRWL